MNPSNFNAVHRVQVSIFVQGMILPYHRQEKVQQGMRIARAMFARSSSNNRQEGLRLSRFMNRKSAWVRSSGAIAAIVAASAAAQESEKRFVFRISETFVELKKQGKVAFIPYLTVGDPNIETTEAAVKLLDKCGADIIELGVPYSDPLADGPVIQAATARGIRGGINLDSVLNLMRGGLSDIKAPIVIFVYYNSLLKRGTQKFLEEAKAAGASGLVVPDLPLEETGVLRDLTAATGMELVLLTTPTTPSVRMAAITEAAQGFIYLVSVTGVTGTRISMDSRVQGLVEDIRQASPKPIAVGFGVSTPEQAAKLAEWGVDGVIIGSAFVKLLGESGSADEGLRAVEKFAVKVRAALAPR